MLQERQKVTSFHSMSEPQATTTEPESKAPVKKKKKTHCKLLLIKMTTCSLTDQKNKSEYFDKFILSQSNTRGFNTEADTNGEDQKKASLISWPVLPLQKNTAWPKLTPALDREKIPCLQLSGLVVISCLKTALSA